MTETQMDQFVFTLMIFFIGFIGGVLATHGRDDK